MGKKKKQLEICKECSKSKRPAINAATLGHEECLVSAYRVLGVFNERDDIGSTPIHYAARNGRLECLQWLVKHSGISPIAVTRSGTTAAHDAAATGYLSCLQYLLEETKCSVWDKTNEGATVLHMACRFGHVGATRWLLERGSSSPREKGANGVTPVHLCAAKNHLECLKYLTRHRDYIPNELTIHGASPVYFAAQEGSKDCLEWLVRYGGGDPFIPANDGMGPIHAAAQAGQLSCLKWLIEYGGVHASHKAADGATSTHYAAASGHVDCLEWLLDHGGSVRDKDNLGGTPLHDAAEQGQMDTISLLLNRGVDIFTLDNEGYMPIDLAKDNDHEECTRLLFHAKTTSLLTSLTPQHRRSRTSKTSTEDQELTQINREKQRQFEAALLSGTSKKDREEIWIKAQIDVMKQSCPSHLKVEDTSYGISTSSSSSSLRHSKRSHRQTSIDDHRSSISSLIDALPKPRPPLSADLFIKPHKQETGQILTEEKEFWCSSTHNENDDLLDIISSGDENIVDIKKEEDLSNDKMIDIVVTDVDEDIIETPNSDVDTEHAVIPISKVFLPDENTTERTLHVDEEDDEILEIREDEEVMIGMLVEGEREKDIPARKRRPTLWERLGLKRRSSSKSTNSKVKSRDTSKILNGVTQPVVKNVSQEVDRDDDDTVVFRKKMEVGEEVVTQRYSQEEEAIIKHKRTSGDLEEISVTFQPRMSNTKQSFSLPHSQPVPDDELSSPNASDEEEEEEGKGSDVFQPLSRTEFESFGQLMKVGGLERVTDVMNSKVEKEEEEEEEEIGEAVMLSNEVKEVDNKSLFSVETMIIHGEEEEEEEMMMVPSKTTEARSKLQGLQKMFESVVQEEKGFSRPLVPLPSIQPLKVGVSERLRKFERFEEFPSHTRKPVFETSIREDEEEMNEELEDHIAPLPSIRSNFMKQKSEDKYRMDGIESPKMKRQKVIESQKERAALFPVTKGIMTSPVKSNLRSFALIKQQYETKGPKPIINSHPLGSKRTAPVFSPLMMSSSVNPLTSTIAETDEESEEDFVSNEYVEKKTNEGQKVEVLTTEDTETERAVLVEENGYESETRNAVTMVTVTSETDKDDVSDLVPREKCFIMEENTTDMEDSELMKPHPISLTKSQEFAFDTLYKLKESLENEGLDEEEESEIDIEKRHNALRTTLAANELSDMIKGLDEMIKSNKSHTNLTDETQLTSSEAQLLSSSRKRKQLQVKGTQKRQIIVTVDIEGSRPVEVQVREDAPVITVIFRAADKAGVQLQLYHTLFEVHELLKIERPLEDHEQIKEIMSYWPRKNPPRLQLHTYLDKYILWQNNPLPKGSISQYFKDNKVPNMSSTLHYTKGGSKFNWTRSPFCLGSLGLYSIAPTKKSNRMDLVSGTDQCLYIPILYTEWNGKQSLISQHCFIMKPVNSWREKDLKLFCAEDYNSYIKWISGIRLVKYGVQLKSNYIAMQNRIDKRQRTSSFDSTST